MLRLVRIVWIIGYFRDRPIPSCHPVFKFRMDHIPRPKNTDSDPFKVPLLASIKYDGQGFESFEAFPIVHNFDFQRDDPRHYWIASFVQSWLYFGLLSEFTQTPIDRSMFVRAETEDGTIRRFVSSTLALKEIGIRTALLPEDDDDDEADKIGDRVVEAQSQEYSRLRRLLDFAQEQRVKVDKRYHQSSFEPLAVILLSVRVLIDTLRAISLGVSSTHITLSVDTPEPILTNAFLNRLMRTNQWCPVHINQIMHTFNSPLVCFISQIRRRHRPEITHENCKDACIAFNIEEEVEDENVYPEDDERGDEHDDHENENDDGQTHEENSEEHDQDDYKYKTRHEEDSCNCRSVSMPVSELRTIVAEGGIPLAFLKQNKNGDISLAVKAATSTDSYVAFSHVWSDGLGNKRANSLPECQLKRLARYIESQPPLGTDMSAGHFFAIDFVRMKVGSDRSKFFWIDTLCIPVRQKRPTSPEEGKDYLKSLSIAKITPTFAGASRVIVLDYEMERFHPENSDWCETSARLLFSAWAGRCWTLQEGSLNRGCHIQFLQGVFDPKMITSDRSKLNSLFTTSDLRSVGIWLVKFVRNGVANMILQRFSRETYNRKQYFENFDRSIRRILQKPLERQLRKAVFVGQTETDIGDELTDKQWLERFVFCWNILARRQTSRAKDRLSILADLLDLNTFELKKSGVPMLSLLRALPGVPLSVLYLARSDAEGNAAGALKKSKSTSNNDENPTDEQATGDDANRWVPDLSSWELASEQLWPLAWTDEWLEFHNLKRSGPADCVFVNPEQWNPDKSGDLILDGDGKRQYAVKFIRAENDEFPEPHSRKICLIIEKKGLRAGEVFQGACLHVLKENELDLPRSRRKMRSHRNMEVSVVYDCPIRLLRLPGEDEAERLGDSLIPWKREESIKTLKIRYGNSIFFYQSKAYILSDSSKSPRLRARLRFVDLVGYVSLPLMMCYGIIGIFISISYFIFIFIAIKSFWKMPLVVKGAILLVFVLHHPTLFISLSLFAWTPILSAVGSILYIYAKSTLGTPGTLDYVFISLSIVGNFGVGVGTMFYKYIIAPKLYDEWLLCFSPKWPHDVKLPWIQRTQKLWAWFLSWF